MSEIIRYVIACIFILAGVFIEITSVFGVFKFKYVLNRMHSAAMGDTLAILFVLLGLVIVSGFTFTSLKLAVLIVFLWLSGPVSSHLIANLTATVDRDKVMDMCTVIEEDEPDKN